MKGHNRSWRRTDTARLSSVDNEEDMEAMSSGSGGGGSITATQRRERFEQVPDANRYEQMKKDREQLRQKYIDQGLLQDPNQKTDLRNAIKFIGTCQDMCPEFEREEREYQKSVDKLELKAGTTNRIDHAKAVKTFHRPAAGNEQPLRRDVRPPHILEHTLSYLIHDIVMRHGVENSHFFVRDRMRSIRQDYTLQNERGISAITVHEKVARYHIACTHLLCEVSSFSESQEMEQLRKVLQSLHEFYDDAESNGWTCENEAEFRSYHLVAHLGDKDILRQSQFYSASVIRSPMVQHALKFHALYQQEGSFQMVDMVRFFRLVAHPATSFLTACLLEHFFIAIRKAGLSLLRNAVNLRQKPSISIDRFASMFAFTDYGEMLQFCNFFGMSVNDNQVILSSEDTTVLNTSLSQSPFVPSMSTELSNGTTEKKVNPLPRRKNERLVTVKMTDTLASYIEHVHIPDINSFHNSIWPPSALLPNVNAFINNNTYKPPPPSSSSSLTVKSGFSFAPFGTSVNTMGSNAIQGSSIQPTASFSTPSFGLNTSVNTSMAAQPPSIPFNSFNAKAFGVNTSTNIPSKPITPTAFNPTAVPTPSAISITPSSVNSLIAASPATSLPLPPPPVPVTKRDTPPIDGVSKEMAQDMLNEQLRQAIFSVWTQSMEEAKEQDRATKERVARDLTSTILQSLLQETLAETLKTTQHQADITQAIIKTSYTISQQLMETALLTTITKLVADKRVEAALYRSTMRRWRAAYQAREAQRIEQQRRIELFRVNTTGIKLGPTRCDQLTLPLTEFHVVRDSLTTTTATTSSTADTIQENPWRPIDWTERLTQLKISDDQQSRSHLWQLSVSVEEEDKLSAAWLEAKMITRQQQQSSLDNNNSNSNDKGITYLITPEMNNSKLLDKNVEASAILFIGSDLSQVDENDTVSMSSYTLEQRERLYALSSSIPGRHIPLLMVFWAHTGSAQEVAFVHRVTDQCSRELTKKRCVILSSQESFNEFDKQIDWLIEHSSLHPIISFYELTRDFSDVFRWTCRRVNQFETTWLLPFSTSSSSTTITTASNIRSDQHRKRSTSFTDAVLRHTIDYVNLLIELFNSYLITLEQLISSYLLNDQQMNNHEFFNQLKIAPTYELLTLQMTAQRLLASIHWIPPAMTLSCNAELMLSQLFRELEVIVLSLIEQHTTSYNALIYMHSTQQQELLSNFRLKAQHILDRIERDFRILPQTSEITKKPRHITTQSSLSQLRSLVHDVQDWLHQSESS